MSAQHETDRCLIEALAYIGLQSNKLEEWPHFAGDVLGMQVLHDGATRLRLRMDEKVHRYIIDAAAEARMAFVGLQVAGPDELAELRGVLERAGHAVHAGSPAEMDVRCVAGLLWVHDPDGNRVEFAHGLRDAAAVFVPGRPIGGFRTGALGLGHLVIYTPQFQKMSDFYQLVMNFRLTDFHHEPFAIEFLRINARHHSLGLISDPGGAPRIHHTMLEYQYWDDLGRAYDYALAHPDSIAVTLGRHLNDHMTSFYIWSPDRFFIEVGWAGRCVDDADWTPQELAAPSLWGHVRNWQTPEKRAQTRRMVAAIGEQGIRAPVSAWSEGPFSPIPK